MLAGKIKVLLVLANDSNAVTYFSATAKEAAFDPLVCPNAFETYITSERKRFFFHKELNNVIKCLEMNAPFQ